MRLQCSLFVNERHMLAKKSSKRAEEIYMVFHILVTFCYIRRYSPSSELMNRGVNLRVWDCVWVPAHRYHLDFRARPETCTTHLLKVGEL